MKSTHPLSTVVLKEKFNINFLESCYFFLPAVYLGRVVVPFSKIVTNLLRTYPVKENPVDSVETEPEPEPSLNTFIRMTNVFEMMIRL